jgi:hypothetical protein
MRTLTRHEKKLTLFLTFAVLAGIHILGLKLLLSWDQANRQDVVQKRDELEEAEIWLKQKPEWEEKSAWLEQNLKTVPAENPAPALQIKSQNAAKAAGLMIEEQDLQDPRSGVSCTVVSMRMKLKGSLRQFIQWAVQLYQPESGVALTLLNLKLSPEPAKMEGEAEVSQFFRKSKE